MLFGKCVEHSTDPYLLLQPGKGFTFNPVPSHPQFIFLGKKNLSFLDAGSFFDWVWLERMEATFPLLRRLRCLHHKGGIQLRHTRGTKKREQAK